MDATVDRIRGRYGIDSVKRAAFLNSQIDHMSGVYPGKREQLTTRKSR